MTKADALAKEIREAIAALESPARHGLTIKTVCDKLRHALALAGYDEEVPTDG